MTQEKELVALFIVLVFFMITMTGCVSHRAAADIREAECFAEVDRSKMSTAKKIETIAACRIVWDMEHGVAR